MINRPAHPAQKLFPYVVVILGLLYVFITPPFQIPDETNHFYRIIQVAQGQFIPDKRGPVTGGTVPRSAVATAESFTYKIVHHPENKIQKVTFENALHQPLNPQDTLFFSFPNSSLYSPVSYLPQVLFVKAGLMLELSPIWLMYGGRIMAVLISVLLLTFAMRLLPGFHWCLFLVALLPMFLYQMASLSGDSFLNSLAVLTWAMAMRAAFIEKQLTGKFAVKIFIVVALLAFCKAGYLLLVLLFLLPVFTATDKAQKRNWILFTIFLFICATVITGIWSSVVKATFSPYGNPNINPDKAIAFIKSNPVVFAGMVLKNILKNIPFYLYGIVGFLGWLDTRLPFFVTVICLAAIVLVVYGEDRKFQFSISQHVFLLGIAAGICLIIIVSQYLVTTAAGSPEIERSQGRYFLPVLLPLLFILRIKYLQKFSFGWFEQNLKTIVPAISIGASLVAFYTLINRFY